MKRLVFVAAFVLFAGAAFAAGNSPFEYRSGTFFTGVSGDYQHDRGKLVTHDRALEILLNSLGEPSFELEMTFRLRKGVANPCAKLSDRCQVVGAMVFHDRESYINADKQLWIDELQRFYQVSQLIAIAPEGQFHFSSSIQKNLMYGRGHLTVTIRKGKTVLYYYRAKLKIVR